MLMTLIAFGVILCAGIAWKLFQANRTIETLLKNNERLETEKQVQAVIIEQKNVEVNNAKIKQKHRQNVSRTSSRNIDEQLHVKGYFRDE